MNSELHHKWNAARDITRGAKKEGPQVLREDLNINKVTLKQNRPK